MAHVHPVRHGMPLDNDDESRISSPPLTRMGNAARERDRTRLRPRNWGQ